VPGPLAVCAVFQLVLGPGDLSGPCRPVFGCAAVCQFMGAITRLELRGQGQGTAHGGRVGPMCTGQLTEPEPAVSVRRYLMAGCRLWLAS